MIYKLEGSEEDEESDGLLLGFYDWGFLNILKCFQILYIQNLIRAQTKQQSLFRITTATATVTVTRVC